MGLRKSSWIPLGLPKVEWVEETVVAAEELAMPVPRCPKLVLTPEEERWRRHVPLGVVVACAAGPFGRFDWIGWSVEAVGTIGDLAACVARRPHRWCSGRRRDWGGPSAASASAKGPSRFAGPVLSCLSRMTLVLSRGRSGGP